MDANEKRRARDHSRLSVPRAFAPISCDGLLFRSAESESRSGRCAFTLLELLAVIAIVAILAAVIFSSLQSGIQASQSAKCMQGQRQLYTVLMNYASDHNGDLPPRSVSNDPPATGATIWVQYVQPALGLTRADGKAMDCPANKRDPYSPTATTFSPKQGYNSAVGTLAKLFQWSSPKIVLLADVAALSATPGSRNNYYFEYNAAVPSGVQNIDPKSFWKIDFTLHQGKANLTFGDGHTQAMRPEDVYAAAKATPSTIFFSAEHAALQPFQPGLFDGLIE
ncbi:MAG: type II secretion system protein [Verrucomicrobia bacterium]|nr:type II secretion system protein [Verrucomicrobiota bacterium]